MTLVINKEHAEFHLELLGPREEYCVITKDYQSTDVKTYWVKQSEVQKTAQEANDKNCICWISLNDKEHNKDNIEGVKNLCVFYTDIDARPKGTKDRLATKEELEASLIIAQKFKGYIENEYAAIGFLAYSGNGFHVFFPLPITPLLGADYRKLVNEKLKAFTKQICVKNNITVDAIDYLRRVTTLIGSFNFKIPEQPLQTKWRFEAENDYQNRKEVIAHARAINGEVLLKAILETEIKTVQTQIENTVKEHPKLELLLKTDQKLNEMFNGNFEKHTGDSDRSKAEMKVVCSLLGYGFSDQEIREVMQSCKIGKWQEKTESYYELTLKNAHQWINEQKATEQPKQQTTPEKKETRKERKNESQADLIVQLCEEEKIELFHDQHQKGYARFTCDIAILNDNCDISHIVSNPTTHINLKKNIECDNNIEKKSSIEELETIREIPQEPTIPQFKTVVYPVSSKHFRSWLSLLLWKKKGKVPGSEALNSALNVLKGKAELEGKEYTLYNRVAPAPDGFYIDMCDDQWRAIKVTAEGWEIIDNPPILFRRYTHQKSLTVPLKMTETEAAQKALDFMYYFNIDPEDHETKLAVLITVITYFIPLIGHPALIVRGAQGTAKSYFFKILRRIIDPSSLELLSIPQDRRELVQILSHHWCCLFDNISYFSQQTSDDICKAVTGGGLSKRQLWTDDDDIIYSFKRCIGLNGINIVGGSSDLLDRSLPIELVTITPENRKTEQELDEQFYKDLPEILGAFLTILSCAIRLKPSINPERKFRLADWTIWSCAIAEALGKTQKDFIDAFEKKVKLQHEEAINSSTVALVLLEYCKRNIKVSSVKTLDNKKMAIWEGTATELLKELSLLAETLGYNIKDKKSRWPQAANALSRSIQRCSTDLETIGCFITTKEGTPRRIIVDATNVKRDTEPKDGDKKEAVYERIKPSEQCDFCRQNAVEFVISMPSGDKLRRCEGCFKNLQKKYPETLFTLKEGL